MVSQGVSMLWSSFVGKKKVRGAALVALAYERTEGSWETDNRKDFVTDTYSCFCFAE